MEYLTRYIKGDTVKMNNITFELLSNGYYCSKTGKIICNSSIGNISYIDMINNNAQVLSYKRKFRNF